MLTYELTTHAREDRADRFAFIATTCGIGEVIHTTVNNESIKTEITSTGVIFIRNADTNEIITFYIARPEQILRQYPNGKAPAILIAVARRNLAHGLWEKQDQVKF